jgi:hypothetical protein
MDRPLMATDQSKLYTGLGLATGTVLTSGNINTAGNGDAVVWQASTGTPVLTTRQLGGLQGNGVELDSTATTEVMRVDLASGSGTADATEDSPAIWLHVVYKPTNQPAVADHPFAMLRSTTGFCGYAYHSVTTAPVNGIQFRGAANTTLTSALTTSPTFSAASGNTPALVAGDVYQIDLCIHRGSSATTGRVQGRVRSLSNPGTWNGGNEYYFDTGYTVNTGVDLLRYTRFYKAIAGSTIVDAQFTDIRWGSRNAPVTSLDKTLAIGNFFTGAPPAINIGDTGKTYLIETVATPGVGGALTFSIAQTAGTAITPVLKASTATSRIWMVAQASGASTTYRVTVSEAGGSTVTQDYVVPAADVASRQFQRLVWSGSAWV